jgi:thioredoxin reductase
LSDREVARTLVYMSKYDVVVVGGGASGLSAALVLSRARRKVLVLDAGHPRNAPASHMQGFLSRDGMPPSELLAQGREEVRSYGGRVVTGTVEEITACHKGGFRVLFSGGQRVTARQVLVATGLRDELPDISGLKERWAQDVLHCPYCHGHEVRDRPLGVIGVTPDAVRYAQIVRQWSDDVVFFAATGLLTETQRTELTARAIGIVEGAVRRIITEDDRLRGVEMDDGRVIGREALFVPPQFVPNNDLLDLLGADLDENGWVRADPTGRTTVPGLWVAGNLANPRAQVITAAGEGSAAAIAMNGDLVDDDVRKAVHDFHPGAPVGPPGARSAPQKTSPYRTSQPEQSPAREI